MLRYSHAGTQNCAQSDCCITRKHNRAARQNMGGRVQNAIRRCHHLGACDVDFAVGCGYKYLNGGPGAPAYLYVAPRLRDRYRQPLAGWMGHAQPFAFRGDYEPASGMLRYLCGTHSVLAMSALEASVELFLEVSMETLRRKSMALGDASISVEGDSQRQLSGAVGRSAAM